MQLLYYGVMLLIISLFALGTVCCDHEYFTSVRTVDCPVSKDDGYIQKMCPLEGATTGGVEAHCRAVASATQIENSKHAAADSAKRSMKTRDKMEQTMFPYADAVNTPVDDAATSTTESLQARIEALEAKLRELQKK